jgi:hypothetical protein
MTLTLTAEQRTDLIDKLVADAAYGHPASVEIDDWTIRCKVEPEECSVHDFWCDEAYGPISEYAYDYHRDSAQERPSNMDGSAVKLQVERGMWMWWQAPPDFKIHTEEWRKLRDHVNDLLSFGFMSVGVELCHGEDAYHRPIVVDCAWLGGVDSTDDNYLASIISDLLHELTQLN